MSGMRWTEDQYQEHMRKQQLAVPDRRTEREFSETVAVMPPADEKPASGPELSLLLPWPPSTNRIWRGVVINGSARTLLSKPGREYRKAVAAAVARQNEAGVYFGDRVGIEIILRPPTKRQIDVDNRIKAIFDALTHSGRIWRDDEQVDVLVVRRDDIVSSGAAFVRVWSETR